MAFLKNRAAIFQEYGDSQSPLVKYLLYIFDNMLRLGIEPFFDMVTKGNARKVFAHLPTMTTHLSYNDHPTLSKVYTFNVLMTNHWLAHRPDVLQFLATICKWWNDVYIEHKNAQTSRIVTRRYAAYAYAIGYEILRYASVAVMLVSKLIDIIRNITSTADAVPPSAGGKQSASSSLADSSAGVEFATDDFVFGENLGVVSSSALRRMQREAKNDESNNEHISEPLAQVHIWTENESSLSSIYQGIRRVLGRLNNLRISELDPLDVDFVATYKPLDLSRLYASTYLQMLQNYRNTALKDESDASNSEFKSHVRLWLEHCTVKNTLKPLYQRFKKRVNDQVLVLHNDFSIHPRQVVDPLSGEDLKDKGKYVVTLEKAVKSLVPVLASDAAEICLLKHICDGQGEDEPTLLFDVNFDPSIRPLTKSEMWRKAPTEFDEGRLWSPFSLKKNDGQDLAAKGLALEEDDESSSSSDGGSEADRQSNKEEDSNEDGDD